tara:strand:+ start:178 stop:351 length:174 start_codon:yes stop_codon:yes gene_type:complete
MTSHTIEIIGIFLALVFAITMYYHGYMILHQKEGYVRGDEKNEIERMRTKFKQLFEK